MGAFTKDSLAHQGKNDDYWPEPAPLYSNYTVETYERWLSLMVNSTEWWERLTRIRDSGFFIVCGGGVLNPTVSSH